MNIKVLGIDIAKNIFELHGVDEKGHVVLKKSIKREKLSAFIALLPETIPNLGVKQLTLKVHFLASF